MYVISQYINTCILRVYGNRWASLVRKFLAILLVSHYILFTTYHWSDLHKNPRGEPVPALITALSRTPSPRKSGSPNCLLGLGS